MDQRTKASSIFVSTIVALVAVKSAEAQWSVTNLHPSGASFSIARGISGGQQVGEVGLGGTTRAALWLGNAASFTDLHPIGATLSSAYGVYGGKQVGFATINGVDRATMWQGSAASLTDLHPVGKAASYAYSLYDGKQVGQYRESGSMSVGVWACQWNGSANSMTQLSGGRAYGTYAGGVVGTHGSYHGAFWNPNRIHMGDYTMALGMHNNQQVGRIVRPPTACMWTGTEGSRLMLAPTGSEESAAYAVHAGVQAGYAMFSGKDRACLWYSSQGELANLHSFLPPEFTDSRANAVWHDRQGTTFVAGYGYNSSTGRQEAILWTSTVPAQVHIASSTTLTRGVAISGTAANMNASDNIRYVLGPGPVFSTSQSPVQIEVEFTMLPGGLQSLMAVMESRATSASLRQSVQAYNFAHATYELLDEQYMITSDRDVLIGLNVPNRYLGPTRNIRLRLSFRAAGPVFSYPWRVELDELTLRSKGA
jgi:hypothetical protein